MEATVAATKTSSEEHSASAEKPNGWLIVIGLLLVVLFVGGVIYARTTGSETTETTVPASSTTPATPASSASEQKQTKTTKTKSVPSDTILTGLLGAGAVLILTGFLYGRISTIKLLGAEVGLNPKETNTIASTAPDELKKAGADPAKDLPKVMDHVREVKKEAGVVELPSGALNRAIMEGVEKVAA